MLIIRQREVREILDGREHDLIDLVGEAYAAHAQGASVLPHSVFLRFPDDVRKRIIGLPGYLGGVHESAGSSGSPPSPATSTWGWNGPAR